MQCTIERLVGEKYKLRSRATGEIITGIYCDSELRQVEDMPDVYYWIDWFEVPEKGKNENGDPVYVMVENDDEITDYGWEIIGKC